MQIAVIDVINPIIDELLFRKDALLDVPVQRQMCERKNDLTRRSTMTSSLYDDVRFEVIIK